MSYVIVCGDEGVQINQGRRLGVVGAGVKVPHFHEVVVALKKTFGDTIAVAGSAENDWIKEQFQLDTFEQAGATMQQQAEFLADKEQLVYAGQLQFTDPRELKAEIKGHMVRPKGVHIANKMCFTLGGGEQTYNLGNYVISADWVAEADKAVVKEVLETQIAFYTKLAKQDLIVVIEEKGELGEAKAAANKAVLVKLGLLQAS